jgi:hypothetical protein
MYRPRFKRGTGKGDSTTSCSERKRHEGGIELIERDTVFMRQYCTVLGLKEAPVKETVQRPVLKGRDRREDSIELIFLNVKNRKPNNEHCQSVGGQF